MRTFINAYIQSEKARREENGDDNGFSLIELIVVVVVLGILAAIAIPIFLNIQDQAKVSAAEAIAGNGASQAAAQLAQDKTPSFANLIEPGTTVDINYTDSNKKLDTFCVTAVKDSKTATSGPGCTGATPAP